MRPLSVMAAVLVATLASSARAAEVEVTLVRRDTRAPAEAQATLHYRATRCIPFVSCSLDWILGFGGGSTRFSLRDRHEVRRLRAKAGEPFRLGIETNPTTLGADRLQAFSVSFEGIQAHVSVNNVQPAGASSTVLEHPLHLERSSHVVERFASLSSLRIELTDAPTQVSIVSGFWPSVPEGWREAREEGREAAYEHLASGARLLSPTDQTGALTLHVPPGGTLEVPLRANQYWNRHGVPQGMHEEVLLLDEGRLANLALVIEDVLERRYWFASRGGSPSERSLVLARSSWEDLRKRAVGKERGVEAGLLHDEGGVPTGVRLQTAAQFEPTLLCVGVMHEGHKALAPALIRVVPARPRRERE